MSRSHPLPAFTLIEILVVSTIIIVLTTISIASFSVANKGARDAKRKSDMEALKQAMVLYRTQNGAYPAISSYPAIANDNTSGLIVKGVLSPPAPQDPVNTSPFVYSGTSNDTSFCLCAKLDNASKGNQTASNCSGIWSVTGSPYYCVRQP